MIKMLPKEIYTVMYRAMIMMHSIHIYINNIQIRLERTFLLCLKDVMLALKYTLYAYYL